MKRYGYKNSDENYYQLTDVSVYFQKYITQSYSNIEAFGNRFLNDFI